MSLPVPIPTRSPSSNGYLSPATRSLEPISGSPLSAFFLNKPPPTSYPKSSIKVLLLENVHQTAVSLFAEEGFAIEQVKGTVSENDLVEKVKDVHILGIRSKTKVTPRVLDAAKKLLAIGCFCIGTDQVDLAAAEERGIPVFNAPFSNTRSVAEKILGEMIMLSRQIPDRSRELHQGVWNKVSKNCWEIRGKTIGIIGYGHIGSQLSVLAEAIGMKVIFYDIVPKLPLGNANPRNSLDELFKEADFVSLHVPATQQTQNMIGAEQLRLMKKGAYLLNASRGKVVVIPDLATYLKNGHLGGAAVDVFPEEPLENGPGFVTQLQGCPNTILTPHIGGSTEEAQAKIGEEVAHSLMKLVNSGCTMNSVNFPEVDVPYTPNTHRILNVHKNVPGVLKSINNILSVYNVSTQLLRTTDKIGYLIVDVDRETSETIKNEIKELPVCIKTRILW